MSNLLDDRGRQAAGSLRDAVRTAELLTESTPGATVGRTPRWSLAAGALAAVAVLAGVSVFRGPEIVAPAIEASVTATVSETIVTSVATTVATEATAPPATAAPVVVTTIPPDTQPPPIGITFPANGHISEEKTITFTGTTEPGALVRAGQYDATVAADGSWKITLILGVGDTVARFVATDGAGNTAEASVSVTYKAPVAKIVDFSAQATYGECSLDPPYDVYYGTAQPGSKVSITSEYGSGSTVANAQGHWEAKVIFGSAPPGKVFLVKVADAFGSKKTFEFVSTVGK